MKKKIGFIGCGKMGGAIIGGILSAKFTDSNSIMASEYSAESAEKKSKELGIKVIPLEKMDNREIGGCKDLQDCVLTVHHTYMQTFSSSNAVKIIENHLGSAMIINAPSGSIKH